MCPFCIGTGLLLLSGSGSAGGVGAAALALRSMTRRKGRILRDSTVQPPSDAGGSAEAKGSIAASKLRRPPA